MLNLANPLETASERRQRVLNFVTALADGALLAASEAEREERREQAAFLDGVAQGLLLAMELAAGNMCRSEFLAAALNAAALYYHPRP